MRSDARKIIALLTPMLLHQAVALVVALIFRLYADQYGLSYDATLVVLIGNLIVIPIAAGMYRKDKQGITDEPLLPGKIREKRKRQKRQKRQIMIGTACFLSGGVLNIALSGVLNLLRMQMHFSNQVQEQLLSSGLPLQLVGLGIAAPVAEELIFRGLTYRRMRQIFPVWVAMFFSALLFAVYHGNLIQMIFAFPMAIVLALIYEKGKLFIFPVLFHMGSNLTAILFSYILQ